MNSKPQSSALGAEIPEDDVKAAPKGSLSKMHQRVEDAKAGKVNVPLGKTEFSGNLMWDKASSTYHSIRGQIVGSNDQVEAMISSFMAEPEIAAQLDNNVDLAEQIQLLARDVGDTLGKLDGIFGSHRGHFGDAKTPEEMAELLRINGEYSDIMDIYHQNVRPTVAGILEKMGVLEVELQEIKRIRAATQPASTTVH